MADRTLHWLGGNTLTETVLHWIDDGLLAIFSLAIGLEIKREVVSGELASPHSGTHE